MSSQPSVYGPESKIVLTISKRSTTLNHVPYLAETAVPMIRSTCRQLLVCTVRHSGRTRSYPTFLLPLPSTILPMSSFPDYYALLNVPKTATAEEIRQAYKRESLRYFGSHSRSTSFDSTITGLIQTGCPMLLSRRERPRQKSSKSVQCAYC